MSVAVVIPAYNEAERLPAVLEALAGATGLWEELIVVDDGSTDATSRVARSVPGVRVISLARNRGKGGAMWAGAEAASADVLCFLDADLVGLRSEHVEALLAPVLSGEADMALGLFRGGRGSTDLSHRLAPWVTGQRCLPRRRLLELPEIAGSRLGVEALLTRAARERGWRVAGVPWTGVTHRMKEEKLGAVRGFFARLRMYGEIAAVLLGGSRPAAPPAAAGLRRDAGLP